jgi:ribonuclease HII
VLGPLVVAGVFVDVEKLPVLARLGVCDSKAIGSNHEARAKRKKLCDEILTVAAHASVRVVCPADVDACARRGELNVLERRCACQILDGGPRVEKAKCDGKTLFSPLCSIYPFLIAEDRADDTDLVVAAASIVAKHHRDQAFDTIASRYEAEFGVVCGQGYANRSTESFLRSYFDRHGKLPEETRLSWSWKVIEDLVGPQQKLF